MALFPRKFGGVFCLGLALILPGCKSNPGPAPPVIATNAALYGNWIGALKGPDSTLSADASQDSVWLVISQAGIDFSMASVAGSVSSLSLPSDTCLSRYPAALSVLSDPNLSFRVNLSQKLHLGSSVLVTAKRSGTKLAGSLLLPSGAPVRHWTATYCATCPNSSITTSIEPSSFSMSDRPFTLAVNGSNFTSCSTVRFDGLDRVTTFVSANQLTITITKTDQATVATHTITVFTPAAGGGLSNSQTLTIGPRL